MKSIYFLAIFLILFGCNPWEMVDDKCTEVEYFKPKFENFEERYEISRSDISKSGTTIYLTNEERIKLNEVVNNEKYWSEGECGTFYLDGLFYIYKFNIKLMTIELGCGESQLGFSPFNINSKYGGLNELGTQRIQELINRIDKRIKEKIPKITIDKNTRLFFAKPLANP